MAKRFSATEIWEEDWFLAMPYEYKLFWFYMLSTCDHAGLFKVNLRSFCALNEVKIELDVVIALFNEGKDRIRVINQSLWLVEDFFVFQYGTTFNPNNRVHESIEELYSRYGIKMTSIRGLKDLKDRVKDKDKDKDIKKGGVGENKRQRGERFDESGEFVLFPTGKKQKLGVIQKSLYLDGRLKPVDITEGLIN